LGIIGLLCGIVVTFTSLTIQQQSVAASSSFALQNELTIPYATSLVIQDLKAEIQAGSIPVSLSSLPPEGHTPAAILYPATPWSAIPARAGKTEAMPPNLVKQSAFEVPFFSGTTPSGHANPYPRATDFPASSTACSISTTVPALNARFIPATRWNKPALLPREHPEVAGDLSPASSGTEEWSPTPVLWKWQPPDWILLQNNGATPAHWRPEHRWQQSSQTAVTHRFAYQLYDVGSLLDLNVAGYDPGSVPKNEPGRRGSPGLADLTQIGFTSENLSDLVSWRNSATLSQPDTGPFGNRYLNFLFSGPSNQGFLRTARIKPPSGSKKRPLTNRAFVSRTQLQEFTLSLGTYRSQKATLLNSLQYLTHFSRSLEQPSVHPGAWTSDRSRIRPLIVAPAGSGDHVYDGTKVPPDLLLGSNYRGGNDAAGGDEIINPAFLEIRATTPFQRHNGALAVAGREPLVHSRFALTSLAWITSRGPSASLPTQHPQHNPQGTPDAIYGVFGLRWNPANHGWIYDHGLSGDSSAGNAVRIGTLSMVQNCSREADFFELLKASIVAGSLGKAAAIDHPGSEANPPTPYDAGSYQQQRDRSLDLQILQIAANLIDQYDPDSFPTQISIQNRIPNHSNPHPKGSVVRGIEDLPYFYRLHLKGVPNDEDAPSPRPPKGHPLEITDQLADYSNYHCGTTSLLALPEIWNPHSSQSATPAGDAPTRFRCIATSEDPDGIYTVGSVAWAAQNRFTIRPNTAFAALRHPNDPAAIFFNNTWPSPTGPPSISNELAAQRGFWRDVYQNQWLTPPPPADIYSVQCYPSYRLPAGADPQNSPSIPPPTFHVDRYYQGISHPALFPRFFALGARNTPLHTIPQRDSFAEVEVRGSELLFEIPDRSAFREPTTLCKPGHPAGSQLRAGPDHWLYGNSYRGKTRGSIPEAGTSKPGQEPEKWLGFSIGERPTAWIVAAKVVNASQEDITADQYGWDPTRGPRETTGYMGSFIQSGNSPAPTASVDGTGKGWYTPNLYPNERLSRWRFFQVTANTVNIQPTLFTVRLQYQHPSTAQWITYDERYIQCEGDFTSRFDYRYSPSDPDGSGKAWYPSDNHQRAGSLPWLHNPTTIGGKVYGIAELPYGHPLVSAYDPRTSRFGHPVTPAFVGFAFFGVMPDWSASCLHDRWVDPLPSPDGKLSGYPFPNSGPLSQASTTLRPASFSPRHTASLMVPGGYSGTASDPKLLGWFPNQIWDSAQTKVINPGTSPHNLTPLSPPRFAHSPWLWGGQPGNPNILRPGWLVENQATPLHQYYADPDDIVRRASGAYATASIYSPSTPISTDEAGFAPAQSPRDPKRQSRPVILNRPFRSVAEMGYAFRGTPWKQLDFFTPESGDVALLDVFCVGELPPSGPVVAGKINLNTRQPPVLRALLNGALKDEFNLPSTLATGSSGEADLAGKALLQHTRGSRPWEGPLTNLSDLTGRLLGKNINPAPPPPGLSHTTPYYTFTIPGDRPGSGAWSYSGFSTALDSVFPKSPDRKIQRFRESVLRALVDSGQTRVWNLMLDLILQTGKYPESAKGGADFVVESENRVWLHFALDRLTGEILDQQMEWISE
jgi:hypothetical protein